MSRDSAMRITDALYGPINMNGAIADLIRQPIVQRLRHVRLSNIDSVCMPGISNISRYEHSIGAAYLAAQVGFRSALSTEDFLVLQAAALIHDSAITPFGHLAEEAYWYLSDTPRHEERWSLLLGNPSPSDVGGIDMQVYLGRESGLRKWADAVFGMRAHEKLRQVFAAINGNNTFGACINRDLDLDNLDNLIRIAFHMGLDVDRELPVRIANAMVDCSETNGVTFKDDVQKDINRWLELRCEVYSRLMASREDFIGKTMLLFATVSALGAGELTTYHWRLSDDDFIQTLVKSKTTAVADTTKRWLLFELWDFSDLFWLESPTVPRFTNVYDFCKKASDKLGRPCFAYRIKDKRSRRFATQLASGIRLMLGEQSNKWLLGVGSPVRRRFTSKENELLIEVASEFFSAQYVGAANNPVMPLLG